MQKSGEYYLKEGKLELSILDDAEDDKQDFVSSRPYTYDHLSMQQPRRRNVLRKTPTDHQKLKVSKEVYNTLHAMGQFLTQKEDDELEASPEIGKKDTLDVNQVIDTEHLVNEETPENREPVQGQFQEVVKLENALKKQEWFCEETIEHDEESVLRQEQIDHIIKPYFRDKEQSLFEDDFLKKLKIHIQNKIEAIKNDD